MAADVAGKMDHLGWWCVPVLPGPHCDSLEPPEGIATAPKAEINPITNGHVKFLASYSLKNPEGVHTPA
jgi:hypothetical protein